MRVILEVNKQKNTHCFTLMGDKSLQRCICFKHNTCANTVDFLCSSRKTDETGCSRGKHHIQAQIHMTAWSSQGTCDFFFSGVRVLSCIPFKVANRKV